jgi:dipeptidyl aminopeptidase/acylaminoacyl peptidase
VYDLPMMFEKGDIPESSAGVAYLKSTLGTDVELQEQRSPAFNAEKIQANVLLIHGKADRRVPINQAKAMKTALDKAGKDYQWLQIDAGGHGYFDDQNREIVYRRILEFLEQNIGSSKQVLVHQ